MTNATLAGLSYSLGQARSHVQALSKTELEEQARLDAEQLLEDEAEPLTLLVELYRETTYKNQLLACLRKALAPTLGRTQSVDGAVLSVRDSARYGYKATPGWLALSEKLKAIEAVAQALTKNHKVGQPNVGQWVDEETSEVVIVYPATATYSSTILIEIGTPNNNDE